MTLREDDKMSNNLLDYIQKEYEVLKDAHFQTSQSITTFFQYVILIFSAPLVLLSNDKIETAVLSFVFVVISLVGFFILLYLSQLRCEALLYARNINKLRNSLYTYSLTGCNQEKIHSIKVMLSQEKKPKYSNWAQFGFIVWALGLLNSFYMGYGMYNLIQLPGFYCKVVIDNVVIVSNIIALIFLALHFVAHKVISIRNENGSDYFNRIIGVDIDGVLNDHEAQFVAINNEVNELKISQSDITTLPVHKSKIIPVENERRVFAQQKYWDKMPVRSDVAINLIEEIKNKLGYKVYLFTWRDWSLPNSKENIKYITKKWLKNHHIKHDKLKFEKGNYDRSVTAFSNKYRARYYYSSKYNIRYFVEDSLENAVRLSQICEYVFLINHGYNHVDKEFKMPYNIIRVNDWDEILSWIKKLN